MSALLVLAFLIDTTSSLVILKFDFGASGVVPCSCSSNRCCDGLASSAELLAYFFSSTTLSLVCNPSADPSLLNASLCISSNNFPISKEDFESEGLRRLLVNAAYWGLNMENQIPERSNVDIVGEFNPTDYGFGTHIKNVKVSSHSMD